MTVLRIAVSSVTLAIAFLCTLVTYLGVDTHPADAAQAAFQPAVADRAALATLARMQDPTTGLWPVPPTGGWWSSANDLTALVDAERALGIHTYDALIARTYAVYDQPAGGYPFRDFTNHYFDDTEWWGLAWLDAYEWTANAHYLAVAEADNAYAHNARVATACGTAIPWAMSIIADGSQLNAITNELGMQLAAELATVTGRASYRVQAVADWAWLQRSGLIGADGLVRDHLDIHCRPAGPIWSYTQGTLSAGLAALAAATGDSQYLRTSKHLADAMTTSAVLNPGGILTEPCEPTGGGMPARRRDVQGCRCPRARHVEPSAFRPPVRPVPRPAGQCDVRA